MARTVHENLFVHDWAGTYICISCVFFSHVHLHRVYVLCYIFYNSNKALRIVVTREIQTASLANSAHVLAEYTRSLTLQSATLVRSWYIPRSETGVEKQANSCMSCIL